MTQTLTHTCEIQRAREILSEEHELFLNFTDELRQFNCLEYLHFEMTSSSRLTLPALADLIFDKKHLAYLQVDFLKKTEELKENQDPLDIDDLPETIKALLHDTYLEDIATYKQKLTNSKPLKVEGISTAEADEIQ